MRKAEKIFNIDGLDLYLYFFMQATPAIAYKVLYEEATARLDQANETIALLRHENALYKKMLFGSRQERFVPTAPTGEPPVQSEAGDAPVKTVDAKEPVPHPGKNPLPPHLPRIDVIVEPVYIPQGSIKIGEENTEQPEYVPGLWQKPKTDSGLIILQ
jgi:transposase